MTSTRGRRSSQPELEGQGELFPAAEFDVQAPTALKPLTRPLWTESKAVLVARYLYYFVLITHHGTYIDGFAGPQNEAVDGWTADLVLRNQPSWLNKFFLFEKDERQLEKLAALSDQYSGRRILVTEGDVNITLPRCLAPGALREKEASFALLDQRTFECEWKTVEYLANLKSSGLKVEQFYFLAQGWLDRAFAATSTATGLEEINAWWGSIEWNHLVGLGSRERAERISERFRNELGYHSAVAWPIYDRGSSGRIMYFMIHATDHLEAPKLMRRAYEWAVAPIPEEVDQLELDFELVKESFTSTFDAGE